MKGKSDVLKKLFTNKEEVDPEELYNLLNPYIKINEDNKSIIFLDATHEALLKDKVILFLLGKKVLFLLGEIDSEKISPKIIIEETGLPKGSVLPTLKQLKEPKGGSLISSDQSGKYFINNYQFSKIKGKLNKVYEKK